jgi:hypothetical protein
MDIISIIKNPITIGLIAGLITYVYMKWKNEKKHNKNKKYKEDDLLIPLAVFIVFWFISYAYFCNEDENIIVPSSEFVNKSYKFKNNISETSDPSSFNLVSNGIQIPNQLPDILFEMH